MDDDGYIIVGLGNPGGGYDGTRHNVGFHIIAELARSLGIELSLSKWGADYCRVVCWGCRICFIKPMTYMNLSGEAVARFAGFYKIAVQNILVIQDDIDMGCGRLKLVAGGGAGGHNGIRSLIKCLGTREFHRLKLGVGRPGQLGVSEKMPVDRFVLSKFSTRERDVIDARTAVIEKGIELFVQGNVGAAMNLINSIKQDS